MKNIIESILLILKGIDEDEISSSNGWWETSIGADFGAKKLNEIIELIKYTQQNEQLYAIKFIEWVSDNKWIRVIGSDSWFLNTNGVVEYKSTQGLYKAFIDSINSNNYNIGKLKRPRYMGLFESPSALSPEDFNRRIEEYKCSEYWSELVEYVPKPNSL